MSELAIKVDSLSKQYRIGDRLQSYETLRERISATASKPARALWSRLSRNGNSHTNNGHSTIWALDDVSFEIPKGDVVAVIGPNGAGKSTLLKILCRITDPTRGYADVYGRVGSLLEVGTGFHPELTGRENIFLNGAILGMKRTEIQRKFDQIVDFAGVERFVDTPVKHYSSGMYLRLAFAVAAHLEPDTLLIDEVLAVGDVAFQRKCLGRMDEVAHEGRTVLFVSHNMGAVRSLCRTGMFLANGRIEHFGDVGTCISRYLQSVGALPDENTGKGPASVNGYGFGCIYLPDCQGNTVEQSQGFAARTTLRLDSQAAGFNLSCILQDMHGRRIFGLKRTSRELGLRDVANRELPVHVTLPPLWLVPGLYSLHFKAIVWGRTRSKYTTDKFPLDVQGVIDSSCGSTQSLLQPRAEWSLNRTL